MAFSATTIWECRSAGSDNNGGGFDIAASGTDRSQQDAAYITFTDLVIDGTTNTKCTSAAFPFDSTSPGNIINITSGTGFTVQRVQIVSVTGGVATCDKSLGTLGSTGGNGKLGGALGSVPTLGGLMVASNRAYLKGSFTQTSTGTFAQTLDPSNSSPATRIEGYSTTRGDNGRATITLSGSTLTAIALTSRGYEVCNLVIDCGSQTSSKGLSTTGLGFATIWNLKISNYTSAAMALAGNDTKVFDCEIAAGTASGGAIAISSGSGGVDIMDCWIHDVTGPGIVMAYGSSAINNLVTNCSTYGIQMSYACVARGNTVYKCSTANIYVNTQYVIAQNIRGNILTDSAIGLKANSSGGIRAYPALDGNAFFNNTSDFNNYNNTTGINSTGVYTDARDILSSSVTVSPFTDPGALGHDNYGLNSTSGGGAVIRGNPGVPATINGSATVTYADMGAAQHQDSGGAAGGYIY